MIRLMVGRNVKYYFDIFENGNVLFFLFKLVDFMKLVLKINLRIS